MEGAAEAKGEMEGVPVSKETGEGSFQLNKRQRVGEESDVQVMLDDRRSSDVVFTTKGGVDMYGHGSVLAARCPGFEKLPSAPDLELAGAMRRFNLSMFTTSAVYAVLSFIYYGSISQHIAAPDSVHMMQPALDVIEVAGFFGLQALRDGILTSCHQLLIREIREGRNALPFIINFFSYAVCSFHRLPSVLQTAMVDWAWQHVAISWWNISEPDNVVRFGSPSLAVALDRSSNFSDLHPRQVEWIRFRLVFLWCARCVSLDVMMLAAQCLPAAVQWDGQGWLDDNDQIQALSKRLRFRELIRRSQDIGSHLHAWLPFIRFCLIHPHLLANVVEELHVVHEAKLFDAFKTQLLCQEADLAGAVLPVRVRSRAIAPPFFRVEFMDSDAMSVTCVKESARLGGTFFLPVDNLRGVRSEQVWKVTVVEESQDMIIGIGIADERAASRLLCSVGMGYGLRCNGDMILDFKHKAKIIPYCKPFGKGSCIVVHMNLMNNTCSFEIDGVSYGAACHHDPISNLTLALSMTPPTGCVQVVCKDGMLPKEEVWKSPFQ